MDRKVPAAIDRMIAVKCKVRVGFKMIDLATGEEKTLASTWASRRCGSSESGSPINSVVEQDACNITQMDVRAGVFLIDERRKTMGTDSTHLPDSLTE